MNTLVTLVIALPAIFLTSLLSGIVGMAGGLILIVLLVALMPVPSAMILHGIVQGVANGSRFWFLREHTAWRILPWYFVGVILTTALFGVLLIVADPAVVLIAAGGLPWVSQFTPERFKLDVTRPSIAFVCGIVVTAVQLVAGASGPILDAFYHRTDLNRFEVVATKAFTQTIGHVVKIIYFLYISATVMVGTHVLLSWWVIGLAVVASLIGTRIGTLVLRRVSEVRFRKWTNVLILGLGAAVAVGGAVDLLSR